LAGTKVVGRLGKKWASLVRHAHGLICAWRDICMADSVVLHNKDILPVFVPI
jgi:hypothetical protein